MNKIKTALLLSYLSLASVSGAIITPALPSIELYYSLNHGQVEWVLSIFLLGYVIGQLLYGPLAHRYSALNALRSGLFINMVGVLLCLCSVSRVSYVLLLSGRFITGLGAAAGLSCTIILLNELLPKVQAQKAMSYAIISFTLGIGLAVTLGGIITQQANWKYCFTVLLAHGSIMLMLSSVFPASLKRPTSLCLATIISGYQSTLKNRTLIVYALVIGFVSSVSYCYSAAAPIYAKTWLQLTPDSYGYWNLINMIGMIISGFLGAYLINKKGPHWVLYFALLCLLPCFILLTILLLSASHHPYYFFPITMLLYLFSGLLFPAASLKALNATKDKANASAMMSFINMSMAMLAVILMGYLPFTNLLSFIIITGTYFMSVVTLILIYG